MHDFYSLIIVAVAFGCCRAQDPDADGDSITPNDDSSSTPCTPISAFPTFCGYELGENLIMGWFGPAEITRTVTAGTVSYVVDDRHKTTVTRTRYNKLPTGVTLPSTNAAGYHIHQVTFHGSTATVAYPTTISVLPTDYTVSSSTLKDPSMNEVCGDSPYTNFEAAPTEVTTLPPYNTVLISTVSADKHDPFGWTYNLAQWPNGYPDLVDELPPQPAFNACFSAPAGMPRIKMPATASLVFATITVHRRIGV